MTEDERRALWAAALDISPDELASPGEEWAAETVDASQIAAALSEQPRKPQARRAS
jgi:hypothetical protein